MLGYLEVKCNGKEGARYERKTVTLLDNYLKRIGGLKEAVWTREKKKREENETVMDKRIAEVIKIVMDRKEDKVNT